MTPTPLLTQQQQQQQQQYMLVAWRIATSQHKLFFYMSTSGDRPFTRDMTIPLFLLST